MCTTRQQIEVFRLQYLGSSFNRFHCKRATGNRGRLRKIGPRQQHAVGRPHDPVARHALGEQVAHRPLVALHHDGGAVWLLAKVERQVLLRQAAEDGLLGVEQQQLLGKGKQAEEHLVGHVGDELCVGG